MDWHFLGFWDGMQFYGTIFNETSDNTEIVFKLEVKDLIV